MEALSIIIVLVSMLAFLFGVVNVVYPLKRLRIRKRLVGVFIILGSMAGCTGGAALGVAAQPGGWEKAFEEAEADRKAEEARAAAAPRPAEKAESAAPPRKAAPQGLTQAEFNGVWSQATRIMAPCDTAVGRASEAMQGGDAYAAYPAVQDAERRCAAASLDMFDLDIPRSAKGAVRDKLREAKDRCQATMTGKQMAMGAVLKVVNGDARPSAVSAARERMEQASTMALGCAVSFMGAAQAAGLTMPE